MGAGSVAAGHAAPKARGAPEAGPEPEPEQGPHNVRSLLRSARQDAAAGRLDAARQAFSRVLEWKPDEPEALFGLGAVMARLNQHERAVELMRRAVERAPAAVDWHSVLAEQLLGAGSLDEAERCARHALALSPRHQLANLAMARCHEAMRRYDEARAHLVRALSAAPGSVHVELALAAVERKSGELDSARDRLERIVARGGQPEILGKALRELGFVRSALGEHDLAFEMFERGGRALAEGGEARSFDRDGCATWTRRGPT